MFLTPRTHTHTRAQTMVAWLLLYAMLQVTWVVFLFASQSYQVAVNLTTNERILWRRMDYLKDEEVCERAHLHDLCRPVTLMACGKTH
jgi:cell division protein FtsB